jgi:hypothetical protein
MHVCAVGEAGQFDNTACMHAPMVVNFYIIVGGEHTVGTTLKWKMKWVV